MTWVQGKPISGYGIENLPYGIFAVGGAAVGGAAPRVGVRLGENVLDLHALEEHGLVDASGTMRAPTLNPFMALGRSAWVRVRARVIELLTDASYAPSVAPHLIPLADVHMLLPFEVADYVDFYSSMDHAAHVGQIFRPGQPALPANWKHLPIGYHGRAGTVIVSGTPVVRPSGQRMATGETAPSFGPSLRLDIEAEVGFVIGVPSRLGTPVSVDDFEEHVFGVVLVNDWSARDIQSWEYVPLGPFLGKSFATSVSAWVVPLAALSAARVPAPLQDPEVLPYLRESRRSSLALELSVDWNGTVVSRPPFRLLYWTPAQQLAHLTVNGASLRTGDLFASGTVSGPEPTERGSFLELSWGGANEITLTDGAKRTFLVDGDTVTITATAPGEGDAIIALGEVVGTIISAG